MQEIKKRSRCEKATAVIAGESRVVTWSLPVGAACPPKQDGGAEPRLPAGACPPLVSTLSFGGDDMSSLSTGPRAEDERSVEGSIPGLIWQKVWIALQPGSSTWLFPEHCLETRRDDVTAGAAGPRSVMTSSPSVLRNNKRWRVLCSHHADRLLRLDFVHTFIH